MLLSNNPARWKQLKELHRATYAAVKDKYPKLPVFFTTEVLHYKKLATEAKDKDQEGEVADLMKHSDVFALSVYPHMSYGVPRPIPADFLDFAKALHKPIAVAESGMTSRDVELKAFGLTLRGSEADQKQFTELMLATAARDRYEFVISFATTDFDKLCAKLPPPIDDLARIWAYTGMQTGDLKPKPALATWDKYLKAGYAASQVRLARTDAPEGAEWTLPGRGYGAPTGLKASGIGAFPWIKIPLARSEADQPEQAVPAFSATERQGEPRPLLVRWLAKAAVILANGYVLFFFSERVFWSFPRPERQPGRSIGDLAGLQSPRMDPLDPRETVSDCLFPAALPGRSGLRLDRGRSGCGHPLRRSGQSVSFVGLFHRAVLACPAERRGRLVSAPQGTDGTAGQPRRFCSRWRLASVGDCGQRGGRTSWGNRATRRWRVSPAMRWRARFSSSDRGDFWDERGPIGSRLGDWRPASCLGWWPSSFFCARVPARPSAALILPPLLLLAAIGLRRSAGSEDQRDLLDEFLGRIRLSNAFALVLIPLTAIATYAPFRLLGLYPATNVVLYLVTMPLGFWFFFRALWTCIGQGMRTKRPNNMTEEALR